jgi:PTH1 family peptidyl-tRNA hydrolase
MADWVLSVFRNQDLEDMLAAAARAAEAVVCYISDGPERAMNRYN